MNLFFFFLLVLLLDFILIMIPFFFEKKSKDFSSIESGFESISKISFKSFSINFFGILVIFVIFDLELFFVLPLTKFYNVFMSLLIVFFITFTFFLEIFSNKIKWFN